MIQLQVACRMESHNEAMYNEVMYNEVYMLSMGVFTLLTKTSTECR